MQQQSPGGAQIITPSGFQSIILPSFASKMFLPYLSTIDGTALRTTCKDARDEVAAYAWYDPLQRIHGSIANWHKPFPQARSANLRYRLDLTNEDCRLYLNDHLTLLVITGCVQEALTFDALKHLKNLKQLDLRGCDKDRLLPDGWRR